jgi:hypothetical protein
MEWLTSGRSPAATPVTALNRMERIPAMSRRLQESLPRFFLSLLFAFALLMGSTTTAALAASTAAQGTRLSSQASRPQWGIYGSSNIYQCCYTGKGEDVLLIHGVDGSYSGADGNDPNGNCQVNFGATANLLSDGNHQWVGNLVVLQYYNHDHCTVDTTKTPNMTYVDLPYFQDTSHCTGYYDGDNGTNNEDDRHVACVMAWWIWDNYSHNNWKVNVVAHSLGGVLIKEALYQIYVNHDSHFPSSLTLDHIATYDSPLAGLPAGGGFACGGCTQLAEMEWGSFGGIYQDITSSAGKAVGQAQGIHWTMEGEANTQCDQVGDSAFGMSYGTKIDYRFPVPGISGLADACSPNNDGNYYYGHGTFLQDNQTANNVEVAYCGNCSSDPPISTPVYNFQHSIQAMFWGSAGNCHASPSNATCDGDDPGVTGCSSTKYAQSGDVSYLTIYWSTGCSTNWAVVSAPSGYLVTVTLVRSATKSWTSYDRHLVYCAPSRTTCPDDTWGGFGQYTTSWFTDMVYAPNESVAVRITTSTGATYTSIWH